jgi:hypothetical protein
MWPKDRTPPPPFEGPIRSLDDLRAYLERVSWANTTAMRITRKMEGGMSRYLNGKRSMIFDLLERIDWPDACAKCGAKPVVSTDLDGNPQCRTCDDLELEKMIDEDDKLLAAEDGGDSND